MLLAKEKKPLKLTKYSTAEYKIVIFILIGASSHFFMVQHNTLHVFMVQSQ